MLHCRLTPAVSCGPSKCDERCLTMHPTASVIWTRAPARQLHCLVRRRFLSPASAQPPRSLRERPWREGAASRGRAPAHPLARHPTTQSRSVSGPRGAGATGPGAHGPVRGTPMNSGCSEEEGSVVGQRRPCDTNIKVVLAV